MNLTFGQINSCKHALVKLTKSELITNWEDILAISDIQEPLELADKKYAKAYNAIQLKYSKLADARVGSELNPKGYNTTQEMEQREKDIEMLDNATCDVSFNFQPVTMETIKLLVEGTAEVVKVDGKEVKTGKKENCLVPADIAKLKTLGIFPAAKKESK